MREIKFRAWDKSDKKLKYSDDYSGLGLFFELKEYREEYGVKYELMQYTGLKDKNGKEIYEGDIVRVNDDQDGDRTYEVIFEKGCYWGNCIYAPNSLRTPQKTLLCDLDYFIHQTKEIIGNIYENPELLEARQ